jgi:hypothetical protein
MATSSAFRSFQTDVAKAAFALYATVSARCKEKIICHAANIEDKIEFLSYKESAFIQRFLIIYVTYFNHSFFWGW